MSEHLPYVDPLGQSQPWCAADGAIWPCPAVGCYICQPNNPQAADEGCVACDHAWGRHVVIGAVVQQIMTLHQSGASGGCLNCRAADGDEWDNEPWPCPTLRTLVDGFGVKL